MRINLLHDYGGRLTGERRIEPGVYDAGDPALFGLAEYLVNNGHAVAVDAPVAEVEIAPEPSVREVVLETLAEVLDESGIGETPSPQEADEAIYSAEDASAVELQPAPTGRKSRKG